jgi:hypothetical protein
VRNNRIGSVFSGRLRQSGALALAVLIGLGPRLSAAQLLAGANVDVGQLLRGEPSAIVTDRGDLFDIAAAVGLNALRLTTVRAWNTGEEGKPYTAAQWHALGERARATGINLLPLVELTRADLRSLELAPDPKERTARSVAAAERLIDTMLGAGGLARIGAVAAIDIANEPVLDRATLEQLREIAGFVHARYPGVPVTVGGWRVAAGNATAGDALGGSSGGHWRWNDAEDGRVLESVEDIVSIHIYGVPRVLGGGLLGGSPPNFVTRAVVEYLREVARWAGHKPILVEEFGMSNGLSEVRAQIRPGAADDPKSQARFIGAVLSGVANARRQGLDISGALVWLLAPRGRVLDLQSKSSSFGLIIPEGGGRPPRLLPGLFRLCPGLRPKCPASLAVLRAAPPTGSR